MHGLLPVVCRTGALTGVSDPTARSRGRSRTTVSGRRSRSSPPPADLRNGLDGRARTPVCRPADSPPGYRTTWSYSPSGSTIPTTSGELAARVHRAHVRSDEGEPVSTEKKVDNKVEEVVGKVKDRVGGATGDRELQAEGQADQSRSNLKQAGEKVKDAFRP